MADRYTRSERGHRARRRDVDQAVDELRAAGDVDLDEALRLRAVAHVALDAGDVVEHGAGERPAAITRTAAAAQLRRRR